MQGGANWLTRLGKRENYDIPREQRKLSILIVLFTCILLFYRNDLHVFFRGGGAHNIYCVVLGNHCPGEYLR